MLSLCEHWHFLLNFVWHGVFCPPPPNTINEYSIPILLGLKGELQKCIYLLRPTIMSSCMWTRHSWPISDTLWMVWPNIRVGKGSSTNCQAIKALPLINGHRNPFLFVINLFFLYGHSYPTPLNGLAIRGKSKGKTM